MADFLRYLGFKAVTLMSVLLPRRFLYWVGLRASELYYFFDRKSRAAVKANLRVILGPGAGAARVRYEAIWVFRNFAKYLAEFFGYSRFARRFIDRYVGTRGTGHLDAALRAGSGGIICSAHFCNWELGGAVVSHLGYPVTAIVQEYESKRLREMFRRQRAAKEFAAVPKEGAALKALRLLRNNEFVAVLGDRDVDHNGVAVTFFGRRVMLPQAPARFAIATGAALIPAFIMRRLNDCFIFFFEKPIPVPEEGTKREKVVAMMQAYADVLAEYVRRYPDQWAVFYRVWDE